MREFRLVFAACDSSGIWRGDIADKLGARLAQTFGGYTRTESRGGHVMADGALCEESVFIFDVATDAESVREYITMAAAEIRRAMGQESVYFRDIDGGVHILAAPKPQAAPLRNNAVNAETPHRTAKPGRSPAGNGHRPQRTAADSHKPPESIDARAAELRTIAERMAAADDRRGGGEYGGAAAIRATAADSYPMDSAAHGGRHSMRKDWQGG